MLTVNELKRFIFEIFSRSIQSGCDNENIQVIQTKRNKRKSEYNKQKRPEVQAVDPL